MLRAIITSLSLPALLLLSGCSETKETGVAERSETPKTPETPTTPETPETPVTLQLPTGGSGRCMAPSVDRLARADVAFDGTVETITGTDVEMRVDSWFTRGTDESVVIATLRGARSTETIPIFRRGDRYLVAASGTTVLVCGVTDAWTPELEVLYQRAFG